MSKNIKIKVDMSEFEGPEGIQRLMKLLQKGGKKEGESKQQKDEEEIPDRKEGDEESYEDIDSNEENESDDEEEVVAREGCSLAYDALNLKLVQEENDMNPLFKKDMIFKPDYVHQIYGQEEEIEGYEDLQINIYLLSGSLHSLIEYSYGKKQKQAEDFLLKLKDNCFITDLCVKRKEFNKHIEEEKNFKPLGDKYKEYTNEKGEKFEIYHCNSEKNPLFNEYKKRMQIFVKFFIEVGSYVDENDYWDYFIVYRVDNNGLYTFVGFANKYQFMFNVNKSRHRISQVVVLPIFQRQGHATHLLECCYTSSQQDPKCIELTVEDPSQQFQIVRDIIETKIVIQGKYWTWFDAIRSKTVKGIFQLEGMKLENEKDICAATKIPKSQIQRIFEIMMLSKLDQSNKQLMDRYKGLFIKNRKDLIELKNANRKIPCIEFEKVPLKVDIAAIIEQKKLLEPNDAFYHELYDQSLEQYNNVINKLKI